MKNLIIKLSLIAILVIACNTAMAVFTDNTKLQVLMHCDETNQAYWLTTPDDNSSGRAANEPILDKCNCIIAYDKDITTQPIMTPGSPAGGSYLKFDGVNDSITCDPGWLGGDSLVCDFSFRFRNAVGEYTGLVSCQSFTCFLSQQGGSAPHISLMVDQNVMINSPITLVPNTWYDVSVRIVNDNVKITVDGSTYEEHSGWPFPGYTGWITVGYFRRDISGFLDGDMDEIRIGNVPEPFTFGLIGLLGLLAWRK